MSPASTPTVSAQDLSARPRTGPPPPRHVRKLAAMVDGFRSIETESAVTTLVTAIWIIPALALLAVGGMALTGGSTEQTDDLLVTIVGSTALLTLFSGGVGLWWVLRAWGNARRLGRAPRLRFLRTFIEHLAMALGGVVLMVLGAFFLAPLALVGIVLLIASSFFVPRLGHRVINELWATSSPSLTSESGTGLAFGWVAAYLVTGAAWGWIEPSMATGANAPLLAVIAGVGMLAWIAVTIAILRGVARRQDQRLRNIVEGVKVAAATSRGKRPSDAEIADAWSSSADMVGFVDH